MFKSTTFFSLAFCICCTFVIPTITFGQSFEGFSSRRAKPASPKKTTVVELNSRKNPLGFKKIQLPPKSQPQNGNQNFTSNLNGQRLGNQVLGNQGLGNQRFVDQRLIALAAQEQTRRAAVQQQERQKVPFAASPRQVANPQSTTTSIADRKPESVIIKSPFASFNQDTVEPKNGSDSNPRDSVVKNPFFQKQFKKLPTVIPEPTTKRTMKSSSATEPQTTSAFQTQPIVVAATVPFGVDPPSLEAPSHREIRVNSGGDQSYLIQDPEWIE